MGDTFEGFVVEMDGFICLVVGSRSCKEGSRISGSVRKLFFGLEITMLTVSVFSYVCGVLWVHTLPCCVWSLFCDVSRLTYIGYIRFPPYSRGDEAHVSTEKNVSLPFFFFGFILVLVVCLLCVMLVREWQ